MTTVSIENKRAHKDIERKQLLISITMMQRNYLLIQEEKSFSLYYNIQISFSQSIFSSDSVKMIEEQNLVTLNTSNQIYTDT